MGYTFQTVQGFSDSAGVPPGPSTVSVTGGNRSGGYVTLTPGQTGKVVSTEFPGAALKKLHLHCDRPVRITPQFDDTGGSLPDQFLVLQPDIELSWDYRLGTPRPVWQHVESLRCDNLDPDNAAGVRFEALWDDPPAVAALYGLQVATASGSGPAVDTRAFPAGLSLFAVQVCSALAAGVTLAGKVQESDDGSTGWTDLVSFTALGSGDGNNVQVKAIAPARRYVRLTWTLGGGSPSARLAGCLVGAAGTALTVLASRYPPADAQVPAAGASCDSLALLNDVGRGHPVYCLQVLAAGTGFESITGKVEQSDTGLSNWGPAPSITFVPKEAGELPDAQVIAVGHTRQYLRWNFTLTEPAGETLSETVLFFTVKG